MLEEILKASGMDEVGAWRDREASRCNFAVQRRENSGEAEATLTGTMNKDG